MHRDRFLAILTPMFLFFGLAVFIEEVASILCYNCTSAMEANCETLPRSTNWIECNGPCQVWKLYSEAESKTYIFERSCNEYCHEGCTHLADMEHRFVGCSSCCHTDFCNVGNNVSAPGTHILYLISLSIILDLVVTFL